jgi:hypothetical protein
MNSKEIIIEVIKQDMRYNQYISALQNLGIEVYGFELDFGGIVIKLMKLKEYPDSWLDLYVTYVSRSSEYEIIPFGNNLYPLDEECYNALKEFDNDGIN